MLSARLAEIVDALPLRPGLRVLEVGCGTGAAARAVAALIGDGHVLAIDRSRTVLEQAVRVSSTEIESGTLSYRCCAVEDFELHPGEPPYDLVFAVRVGALDGRHPESTEPALRRIVAATAPGARLFIDCGSPLVEFAL